MNAFRVFVRKAISMAAAMIIFISCTHFREDAVQEKSPQSSSTERIYSNPVLDGNFPDPFVLRAGDGYHLYATNGTLGNIQHAFSRDLVNWRISGDVLPILPVWAKGGLTWAPEVIEINDRYLMYYTLRDKATNVQCISVASSDKPEGPFVDLSTGPFINQPEIGGSIDASPFRDADGSLYLYWKNDGNALGMFTTIYAQKLSPDGFVLQGERRELMMNDRLWEGNVVEAPTMHEEGGYYYLLYSASDYASDLYGVGYAVGPSPMGPFKKSPSNPLIASMGAVAGPGHQCIVKDAAGTDWLVYHAWTAPHIGDAEGVRSARIDPIVFSDGKITFEGPSEDLRSAPVGLR